MKDGGNVVWLFDEPLAQDEAADDYHAAKRTRSPPAIETHPSDLYVDDATLPLCGSAIPWEQRMRDDLCTMYDLREALESRGARMELFGLVELDDELESGLCQALEAFVCANDGGNATVPGMVVRALRCFLWALPHYSEYVHPACGIADDAAPFSFQ